MSLSPTPGQTIGPFFHYALPYERDAELVAAGDVRRMQLHGTIFDGAGKPVPDALVELWQCDERGQVVARPGSLRRDDFTFTGWGRSSTDRLGHYSFATLTPGPTTPGDLPFFSLSLFARGLLDRLVTRAYVPVNGIDTHPNLQAIPEPRRHTLIASAEDTGFRFDVHLQGHEETVFFDYRHG